MYSEQQLNDILAKFSTESFNSADAAVVIANLVAEVRSLNQQVISLSSDAASAFATKNVAKEILTTTVSIIDKHIKMNASIEDEEGRKMSDGTMTDLKARLESALRVL